MGGWLGLMAIVLLANFQRRMKGKRDEVGFRFELPSLPLDNESVHSPLERPYIDFDVSLRVQGWEEAQSTCDSRAERKEEKRERSAREVVLSFLSPFPQLKASLEH